MNEILQKKIEEAAKAYADGLALPSYDMQTIHAIDFEKGAHFALNNQWISVEEGLPTYDEAVIGMDYAPELAWDDQTIIFVHRSNNPDVITDKNKFCVYPPRFCKVTHWMPIPKMMKGGEK